MKTQNGIFSKVFIILTLTLLLVSLSACGFLFNKECEHSYTESITDSTCVSEGVRLFTCSECGESYQETIAPKGHSYTDNIVNPNCLAEGYTEHICSACGDVYKDNFTPKTIHRFNGAECLYCSMAEPTDTIEANTEWYSDSVTVFTLKTKEELAGFASLVNSGTNFSGKTVHIGCDIDLEFKEWIPIGNATNAFAGTFDGDGYTISGLKINVTSSYIGFFGNVTGNIGEFNIEKATIYSKDYFEYVSIVCGYAKNGLSNVNVLSGYLDARECKYVGAIAGYTGAQISLSGNNAEIVGSSYVGGIAGCANVSSAVFVELKNTAAVYGGDYTGGIIGSVTSNGVVLNDTISNVANVTGKIYIGGIYGYISANSGSGIKNSSVSGEITGEYYVGGLVGKTDRVAITDCSNSGTSVNATSCLIDGTNFYAYLGGYVGYGSSVSGCINNSDINYISRGAYVGGIAGYLTSGVSNCKNHGNISSGSGGVGGIVGYLSTTVSTSISNLTNTGNVSGLSNRSVGGIIGNCMPGDTLILSNLSNSGNILSTSGDAGGIVGCMNYANPKTVTITASDLKNTGNVTAKGHAAGGLFGFIGGSSSSVVKNSSSSANVKGAYYVGGLIGWTDYVTLQDSSNDGTTVEATGWLVNGEATEVFLGGYVGKAYKVSGCTNNIDIKYESVGVYVGGIAGCAVNQITNCTNNGNISSTAACVGGIVGYTYNAISNCTNNGNISSIADCVGGIAGEVTGNTNYTLTFTDIHNNGNVSGLNRVGGVIGRYTQDISYGEKTNHGTGGDGKTRYYDVFIKINGSSNSGNVSGSNLVGGIVGGMSLNNTFSWWDSSGYSGDDHNHTGRSIFNANNLKNIGTVSGTGTQVGEIMGYFSTDGDSSVTTYTVIGLININGEKREGNYDIGEKGNISFDGREVYVEPEEIPETDSENAESESNT